MTFPKNNYITIYNEDEEVVLSLYCTTDGTSRGKAILTARITRALQSCEGDEDFITIVELLKEEFPSLSTPEGWSGEEVMEDWERDVLTELEMHGVPQGKNSDVLLIAIPTHVAEAEDRTYYRVEAEIDDMEIPACWIYPSDFLIYSTEDCGKPAEHEWPECMGQEFSPEDMDEFIDVVSEIKPGLYHDHNGNTVRWL